MERVTAFAGELLVDALSVCSSRPCPDCGVVSRRVHSRYCRTLADCPVGGRPLLVRLTVRRFFCDSTTCLRHTLVEQVSGLTERHQQASTELRSRLRAIAAELGGRAGARLCRKLSVPAGRMRLLRLINAPAVVERAPRVLVLQPHLGVVSSAFVVGVAGAGLTSSSEA